MPNNKLERISSLPESRLTEHLVREWLVKFAELYRKNGAPYPLTAIMTALWIDSLNDLATDQLEAACRSLVKAGCRREFPVPADVRGHLEQAEAKGFELEAETEWQRLLAWVRQNVFPDTGIRRGAPKLAPAVEHAAKAAGGIYFIERCPEDQLVWCRKTFLAAFKNIHETRQAEHLLGDGEAKRILAELVTGADSPKQIASPPEDTPGQLPPRAEVRAVLERVADIPSEEEWERRKREQKQHAAAWIAAHPETVEQGAAQ